MNIIGWLLAHANILQVTPPEDTVEFQIDWGQGCCTVQWDVGDESYSVDFDFRNFTVKSETRHERHPDTVVSCAKLEFSMTFGNLPRQIVECRDAHVKMSKEYDAVGKIREAAQLHSVSRLLENLISGSGWCTVLPGVKP